MPNLTQPTKPTPDASIERLEQESLGPKAGGGLGGGLGGGRRGALWPTIGKYIVWQLIALLCVEAVLSVSGLGVRKNFCHR